MKIHTSRKNNGATQEFAALDAILRWWTILLLLAPVSGAPTSTSDPHQTDDGAFQGRQPSPPLPNHRQRQQPPPKQQPNFVIILTDDLDWTLGGTHASTLRRTRKLIGEQGKTFTNWFVQTPVCCPSRAELLTGKMNHNLRLPRLDPGKGCMHIDVSSNASHPFYQRDYFAKYFEQLDYTVGIFGKHLNNANPTDFLPNGVDEMLINGGGVYNDPTFTVGNRGTTGKSPRPVTFNNCTKTTGMPCYSTAIIGNSSLAWIQRHVEKQQPKQKRRPFLALISVKAPHILDGPDFPLSIPAPWYENATIPEELAPRTPNYNYSAPDHHWIVRNQLPLTYEEAKQVDALYVSRLKTLLSVDDLVEDLIHQLDRSGTLNDTYIVFTSDNGYRLGQFRMPMCKLHPYENDIRVPMMIRGPKIRPNTTSSLLSTHVNLMPTLLGFARQHTNVGTEETTRSDNVPSTMDGTNLASCILDDEDDDESSKDHISDHHCTSASSHSSLLIEYLSLGNVFRYNHTIDTYNHSFLALRMMQPHDDDDDEEQDEEENEEIRNDKDKESSSTMKRHWMYLYDFSEDIGDRDGAKRTRAGQRNEGPSRALTQLRPTPSSSSHHQYFLLQNLKYMEYRDSRYDWNATRPPLEQELFDLDRDPYEMHNLIRNVSPLLIQALQFKLQRLFQCQGDSCRLEQRTKVELVQSSSSSSADNDMVQSSVEITTTSSE